MYRKYFKRLIDITVSLFSIIILFPLLVILSIMIKLKIGKPVIFKQERPGLNGKIFTMHKFRTMTNTKDKFGILLPDGLRLTRFGRWLRNSSLDELPELFNILKGDMSIVGPRPLLVKYLPLYNEEQMKRHNIRPGLTGYAQVYGRNFLSWEERFEMDVRYAKNVTFLGDLKIVFKTVQTILKRDGIDSDETSKYTMKEFTGTQKTYNNPSEKK